MACVFFCCFCENCGIVNGKGKGYNKHIKKLSLNGFIFSNLRKKSKQIKESKNGRSAEIFSYFMETSDSDIALQKKK